MIHAGRSACPWRGAGGLIIFPLLWTLLFTLDRTNTRRDCFMLETGRQPGYVIGGGKGPRRSEKAMRVIFELCRVF